MWSPIQKIAEFNILIAIDIHGIKFKFATTLSLADNLLSKNNYTAYEKAYCAAKQKPIAPESASKAKVWFEDRCLLPCQNSLLPQVQISTVMNNMDALNPTVCMEISRVFRPVKSLLAFTALAAYHKAVVYVFSSRCKPLLIDPRIVTQGMSYGIAGAIAVLHEVDSHSDRSEWIPLEFSQEHDYKAVKKWEKEDEPVVRVAQKR